MASINEKILKPKLGLLTHRDSSSYRKSTGFTLVELSIVIVIIGLIFAGVTAGQSLVHSSKLRSVISEVNNYKVAVSTFKLQYLKIPGDINNAVSYWGGGTANGNGNDFLDSFDESIRVWQHLSLAALIPGSYTGTHTGNVSVIGINVPKSAYPNAGWLYAKDKNYTMYGVFLGHFFIHAGSIGAPWHDNQAMRGVDGLNIDKKIDDGVANLGKVIGARGWPLDLTAGRCVDQPGTYTSGIVNYLASDKEYSCRMYFLM